MEEQKPTFNPQLSYQWQPDQQFSLAGSELHILKQVLGALTQPVEAQRAIAAYESLKIVDGIIKKGVEDGIIIPAPKADEGTIDTTE